MDSQQKARVTWLKLGDDNTAYFHNARRERGGRNRIDRLVDDDGTILDKPKDIEVEVLRFYKNLLSSSSTLKAIDPKVLSQDPLINRDDSKVLIREVTTADIDAAMWSIGVDKSPGIDGYNVKFFKKSWDIVKYDIYDAVLDFFARRASSASWNMNSITLIPNHPQASQVKDFGPISCCSVVYKIIAKILASRLQSVSSKIISQS